MPPRPKAAAMLARGIATTAMLAGVTAAAAAATIPAPGTTSTPTTPAPGVPAKVEPYRPPPTLKLKRPGL